MPSWHWWVTGLLCSVYCIGLVSMFLDWPRLSASWMKNIMPGTAWGSTTILVSCTLFSFGALSMMLAFYASTRKASGLLVACTLMFVFEYILGFIFNGIFPGWLFVKLFVLAMLIGFLKWL